MEIEIVELEELSGNKSKIYSVILDDDKDTLFDLFLDKHIDKYKDELKDIILRLESMGKETGALDIFFKLHEGSPGDNVCALYDSPQKNLRLYCIKYNDSIVILGGGAPKPKNIKAYQEDISLNHHASLIKKIAKGINNTLEYHKDGSLDCSKKYEI